MNRAQYLNGIAAARRIDFFAALVAAFIRANEEELELLKAVFPCEYSIFLQRKGNSFNRSDAEEMEYRQQIQVSLSDTHVSFENSSEGSET